MINFNRDYLDQFLGIVRKYMQMRGNLSQKDLADKANIGVSTISRLINQKTKEIDPQTVARIVVVLNIPLHEIIDFIAEDSEENFKKMVQFQRDVKDTDKTGPAVETNYEELGKALDSSEDKKKLEGRKDEGGEKKKILTVREKLESLSPRQKAFINDFLNLDEEGRDLLVDLGGTVFRYFRQKGYNFDL